MTIGFLQLEIKLLYPSSLKDKRSVLKRMKNLTRKKFNVSVAELANLQSIRSTVLGFVTINTDNNIIHNTLNNIENLIEKEFDIQIINRKVENL